ncbi:MAG TPA: hypothetical protein VN939_08815 [Chthoniobacterales bacterium]|nr:hypothetical protein [Chthoniobacterales bacterium]
MTAISAKILAVDNVGTQYRVAVRIGFPRYRGSFFTLKFGEKKPFTGFTHNGQLDLVYHEDPHLKAGQSVSALDDSVTDPVTYAT